MEHCSSIKAGNSNLKGAQVADAKKATLNARSAHDDIAPIATKKQRITLTIPSSDNDLVAEDGFGGHISLEKMMCTGSDETVLMTNKYEASSGNASASHTIDISESFEGHGTQNAETNSSVYK